MKRILTIAGSDSGGGAGIQADLKTIALLGAFGTSAVTALTAQNTMGVQEIHLVPPGFVAAQIDAVVSDIGIDVVKTGMLACRETIRVVADRLAQYRIDPVVVDPVMVAKGGSVLLPKEARTVLLRDLLPLAYLVTPNLPEAAALSGLRISDPEDMKEAARVIHRSGVRYVLIKGGHLRGTARDILFDGEHYFEYESARIKTKNTHGTGCTYAAAIAVFLAQGRSIQEAVREAKVVVTEAIRSSLDLGGGHGPVNPYVYFKDVSVYRRDHDLRSGGLGSGLEGER